MAERRQQQVLAPAPGVIPDGAGARRCRPPAQTLKIHPDFQCVCVWPQNACSVAHMWRRLESILPREELRWVCKVARIFQPDGRVRFDIFGRRDPQLAERVLARLRGVARRGHWWCRLHQPWGIRHRLRRRLRPAVRENFRVEHLDGPQPRIADSGHVTGAHGAGAPGGGIKIATWNVRSLAGKRPELELYLRAEDIGILAIQETHRLDGGWPLRVRGYQVFETPAVQGQRGQVGLALLVRNDIPAYQVGDVNPFTVCARVTLRAATDCRRGCNAAGNVLEGGDGDTRQGVLGENVHNTACDFMVASVYIPPAGYPSRKLAMDEVRALAERWAREDLDARFILMGDWNSSIPKLERAINRWRGRAAVSVQIRQCSGSSLTYQGLRKWRDLDHMVVSPAAAMWLSRPQVNRTWDGSDHWPLEAALRAHSMEGADRAAEPHGHQDGRPSRGLGGNGVTVQVNQVEKCKPEIAHHNLWDALLADQAEGDADGSTREEGENAVEHGLELDARVAQFEDALAQIGQSLGVVTEDAPNAARHTGRRGRLPGYKLSGKARRAIRQRRQAHVAWVEGEGPARGGELWHRYMEARGVARKAVRDSMRVSWLRFVSQGAQHLRDHQLREFWCWARQVMGRSRHRMSSVLVLPGSGRLTADPREQLEAWAQHYQSIAADETGHSRDFAMWAERFPDHLGQEPLPEQDMDGDIGWAELNTTLRRMSNWKAAGVDGIPAELLKAAVQEEDDPAYDGVVPGSPMGKVLLAMVNKVFQTGTIPDRWRTALVVSVPKKGDLTMMDNYRGISLLPVLLKAVTTMVIRRITRGLEARRWFRREQAGFRAREECPAQVAALQEILVRRRNQGKRTYLAFVDMRKAYDTVPHGALLRKLWLAGVRGRAFAFMRALYEDIRMAVLTPHGSSECVPVLRGVRQGCPASPAVFNIFVNDILDGLDRFGVTVPGLAAHDGGMSRVAGLLFADDLVVLAPSRRRLGRMLRGLDRWAATNEMSFGISKCGIMGVGRDGLRLNEQLRREADRWQLGGANVPIVDTYTYLGLTVTPSLSAQDMVDDRVAKGWKAFHALRPVLECTRIPLGIRVRLVKATLLPTIMYGAELWGMSAQRCAQAERLLREVLRSLLRLSRRCTLVSAMTLSRELSIPPVHARASAARARAFSKYASLRTVVAGLVRQPTSAGRSQYSWAVASRSWMRRHCPAPPALQGAGEVPAPPDTPRAIANRVRTAVWDSMAGRQGGSSLERYRQAGLEDTNGYISEAIKYPALAAGVHWLAKARVGALWVARAYVRIRWLPVEYSTRCPFCDVANAGETLGHLMVECPRWDEFRAPLQPLVDEARARLGHRASVENVAVYLLGGRVSGDHEDAPGIRCDRWVTVGRVRAPQMGDAEGVVDDADDANGVDGAIGRVPGFVQVAQFLQAVMPVRCAVLSPLLNPPRADAGDGRAALQPRGGGHPGDDPPA